MDLKSRSLELYNFDAIVKLKEKSEPFNKYGEFLNGVLIERIWGEPSTPEVDFKFNSTVTALKFKCNETYITISCDDIECLSGVIVSTTGDNDIALG